MRSILLLVKRDLRKRPGQAIGMLLMAMLAGLLANTGLLLATDYATNLTTKTAEWNAPDTIAVLANSPTTNRVISKLQANPDVRDMEVSGVLAGVGKVPYGDNVLTVTFSFYDKDAPVRLNQRTITEVLDRPVENPVWAPAVMLAAGHYRLGDEIALEMPSGQKLKFHIQGFVEDTFGGVPGFGSLSFGLTTADFAALKAPGLVPAQQVKLKTPNAMTGSTLLSRTVADANREMGTTGTALWASNLDYISSGAGMSAGIFSTILVAFAAMIVIVAAVMMRFLLRNLINVDTVSFGMLRAGGYTTGRIMAALVATFATIAVFAAALGIGLSYLVLPAIQSALRAQNGITWAAGFSPVAALLTIGGLVGLVAGTAWLSASRIRRMSTVTALRGGTATHSFRPSPLPLASSRGPLQILLGIKSSVQHLNQSAVIAVTVAIVTFAAVFTFGMTSSLFGDSNKTIEMLVGELDDVGVYTNPGVDPATLQPEIEKMSGVKKVFVSTTDIEVVNGSPVAFLITDDPGQWRYDPVYEGRLPRRDNEAALGARMADQLGLKVGGSYRLDLGYGDKEYLITGIATGARNLGQFVVMTTDAYKQVDPGFKHLGLSVYVDGDSNQVISQIKARFSNKIEEAVDTRQNVTVELSGYLSAVPVVSATIITFTGIVVVLVVGLIVTTMLVQSRRELGIKKAMGYTHRQLEAQTRWTYLPSVAIGAAVGAAAGAVSMAPLLGALLRSIGVLKVEVDMNLLQVVGLPVAIVALAWLVIAFTARRIKRVSAYALVTE